MIEELIKYDEVYTYRRFWNGDIIPIKGKIMYIVGNVISLETEIGTMHKPESEVYTINELPKLREKIRLLELARLPKEIEILERDLAHKKRKLDRLLKGEENE